MIIRTKFQVAILRNAWVLPFWMPKKAILRYLRGFRHFSYFQFLPDLGRPRSVLEVIFCVLDENLAKKTCIAPTQTQDFEFDLFENLTFVNLHLAKGHKRLRRVRRGIPDTINVVPRLDFNLIRLLCPVKPTRAENKKIFDPTCDVIIDVTDNILQNIRRVHARSYQMPFSDRESAQ